MLTVGLTGGIASGKSTVAAHFAELGIRVVNADTVAREVVEPGTDALASIAEYFGEDFIDAHGELLRGKLRERVFNQASDREWLEGLLHPLIAEQIQLQLHNAQSPYSILESPLLLETNQQSLVDRILVVDVQPQTQLTRALSRDGSKEETIKAIIAAQIPRTERLKLADDIIDNDTAGLDLRTEVATLHARYLELAS